MTIHLKPYIYSQLSPSCRCRMTNYSCLPHDESGLVPTAASSAAGVAGWLALFYRMFYVLFSQNNALTGSKWSPLPAVKRPQPSPGARSSAPARCPNPQDERWGSGGHFVVRVTFFGQQRQTWTKHCSWTHSYVLFRSFRGLIIMDRTLCANHLSGRWGKGECFAIFCYLS